MSIKVKIERELDEEFVGDVLITAFDGLYGACWYWAQSKRRPDGSPAADIVRHPGGETWGSVHIAVRDDFLPLGIPAVDAGNDIGWTINGSVVQTGMQRILDYWSKENYIRTYILNAVADADAGCIDAEAADAIIQEGLLGKIVFS